MAPNGALEQRSLHAACPVIKVRQPPCLCNAVLQQQCSSAFECALLLTASAVTVAIDWLDSMQATQEARVLDIYTVHTHV